MKTFTPTTDFDSEEMASQYLKGFTYRVMPGTKLADLVERWFKEGKVTTTITGGPSSPSKVTGKGKVT